MIPMHSYLGVGVLVLLIMLIDSRIQRKKNSNAVFDYLNANNPNKRNLANRIIDKILAPCIGSSLIIVFWPIALTYFVWDKIKNKKEDEQVDGQVPMEFTVSMDHLLEKLSRSEIEQREFIDDPLCAVPHLPFGHLNSAWLKFLGDCEEGDTLWSFAASLRGRWVTQWRWDPEAEETRKGYARVRQGRVLGFFTTVYRAIG